MNPKKYFLLLYFLSSSTLLLAQQTVGLFTNTPEAFPGYTLFAPIGNNTTYLINNCGQKVHSWTSTYPPAMSAYLLEDGSLLRTKNASNSFFPGGGSGGGIEQFDWEGNLIWEYTISSDMECQHHDIEYLPNGNILALVWDKKTSLETAIAGRTKPNAELWSEKIIEIKPDLVNGGGTIVWEWKVWDHLVQDIDSTKTNYGIIANSPERININYNGGIASDVDWLHFNSIDYNADLDQILISCHRTNEIWIIDHSTTLSEAAGRSGGRSGKGGDLLFRWGNPRAYNRGVVIDQKLFRQHDAQWIDADMPGAGTIMVFNNQAGGQDKYSTVNIITPPIDENGHYELSGMRYGPSDFSWTYQAPNPTDFFSTNISGASRLANGNTLICEGTSGKLFEINDSNAIVWEYVNPISGAGITTQGDPRGANFVFRCTRYPKDYAAFNGRNIRTQGYIEAGSSFSCIELHNEEIENEADISIYPNPSHGQITIDSEKSPKKIRLYNSIGALVYESDNGEHLQSISTHSLAEGMYFLHIELMDGMIKNERLFIAH